MHPVCVKCNQKMDCDKNGAIVMEIFQGDKPYKLWRTDMYKCPICGFKVITGWADKPMAEHFQDNFKRILKDYKDEIVCKF